MSVDQLERRLQALGTAYAEARRPRPGLHAELMAGAQGARRRVSLAALTAAAVPLAALALLLVSTRWGGTLRPRVPIPAASPQPTVSPYTPLPYVVAPLPSLSPSLASPVPSGGVRTSTSPQGGGQQSMPAGASPASSPLSFAEVIAQACAPAPDFCWLPPSVEIHAGGYVVWTDQTPVNHRVQSTSSNWTVRADIYGAGTTAGLPQSYRYDFTAPGTYTYICGIHTYMTGRVVVDP